MNRFRRALGRVLRWGGIALGVCTVIAMGYGARKLWLYTPGAYQGAAPWSMQSPDPPGTPREVIFFTTLRPSNWDIFLFRQLGQPPDQLTRDPSADYNAALAPGGRWVVFTSERGGNADLFALDLERGGEPVALTRNLAFDDAAAFSPDGRTIAFVSNRGGSPDLYVMPFDPAGTAEASARRITDDPGGEFNPRFSPDGRTLAFTSNRDLLWRWHPLRLIDQPALQTRIYTVGVDGHGLRRLTSGIGLSGRPAWSADGRSLYYYKATAEMSVAVRAVDADGTHDRRLTPESMVAVTPVALSDGNILFVRLGNNPLLPVLDSRGGTLQRMRGDGSGIEDLGSAADSRKYNSPNCDPQSGLVVAHGHGGLEGLPLLTEDKPLSWPAARHSVKLSDRTVEMRALRAYFPSFSPALQRGVAGSWLFEALGKPPGPSPIVSFDANATTSAPIWQPPEGFAWGPVVSRDGRFIVFSIGPRFGAATDNVDIWRVGADGTGVTNLTADSAGNDAFPDLSADGTRVVFRSGRSGDSEIYVMNAEGKDVRRISDSSGTDTMPAISPDGRWTVYSTSRTGRGMKLWMQSIEDPRDPGHELEPGRSHLFGTDMHPRFSPDGRWVVFTSDRAGMRDEWYLSALGPQPYGDLFAVRADGTGPAVQLTNDKWEDGLPFWTSVN